MNMPLGFATGVALLAACQRRHQLPGQCTTAGTLRRSSPNAGVDIISCVGSPCTSNLSARTVAWVYGTTLLSMCMRYDCYEVKRRSDTKLVLLQVELGRLACAGASTGVARSSGDQPPMGRDSAER